MTKMKRFSFLSLLFFCGLQFYTCASLDRPDQSETPPVPKVGNDQASPSLGQFIMGKAPPKPGKEEKEERKERRDGKEAGHRRENKTRHDDKPPGLKFNHACPPCPCVPQASQPWTYDSPRENENRSKRSTNDDYWFSTGSPNSLLSQVNMGYQAQQQMRDYMSKYGPPLHVGTISKADFNYPNDFHAFNQPATSFTDIPYSVVYELRGPIEVSPVGLLVPGLPPGALDAFSTILKTGGLFKLVGVQTDGLMKLVDEKNAVFNVDCNKQRYGGCQNLVQVHNAWTVPKFAPVVSKAYVLTGFLDVTLTEADTASVATLQSGIYSVESVITADKFRMKDMSNSAIYFVNCLRQRLPKTCENLKPL